MVCVGAWLVFNLVLSLDLRVWYVCFGDAYAVIWLIWLILFNSILE